ncbi:MAG: hypothetical protein JWP27_2235 [Flaviaesturariibacter sp.]|nr:hypothetical protein [Flaviaesturariibacter sp.]
MEIQPLLDRFSLEPSDAQLRRQIAEAIDWMIVNRFDQLVNLLYTVDVSEKRLKSVLAAKNGENASGLITALLLERLAQKAAARARFRTDPGSIAEEEGW